MNTNFDLVVFGDENHITGKLYGYAADSTQEGYLYQTKDGGKTWVSLSSSRFLRYTKLTVSGDGDVLGALAMNGYTVYPGVRYSGSVTTSLYHCYDLTTSNPIFNDLQGSGIIDMSMTLNGDGTFRNYRVCITTGNLTANVYKVEPPSTFTLLLQGQSDAHILTTNNYDIQVRFYNNSGVRLQLYNSTADTSSSTYSALSSTILLHGLDFVEIVKVKLYADRYRRNRAFVAIDNGPLYYFNAETLGITQITQDGNAITGYWKSITSYDTTGGPNNFYAFRNSQSDNILRITTNDDIITTDTLSTNVNNSSISTDENDNKYIYIADGSLRYFELNTDVSDAVPSGITTSTINIQNTYNQNNANSSKPLFDIVAFGSILNTQGSKTGYAASSTVETKIYQTINGGKTWEIIENCPSLKWKKIVVSDDGETILALGYDQYSVTRSYTGSLSVVNYTTVTTSGYYGYDMVSGITKQITEPTGTGIIDCDIESNIYGSFVSAYLLMWKSDINIRPYRYYNNIFQGDSSNTQCRKIIILKDYWLDLQPNGNNRIILKRRLNGSLSGSSAEINISIPSNTSAYDIQLYKVPNTNYAYVVIPNYIIYYINATADPLTATSVVTNNVALQHDWTSFVSNYNTSSIPRGSVAFFNNIVGNNVIKINNNSTDIKYGQLDFVVNSSAIGKTQLDIAHPDTGLYEQSYLYMTDGTDIYKMEYKTDGVAIPTTGVSKVNINKPLLTKISVLLTKYILRPNDTISIKLIYDANVNIDTENPPTLLLSNNDNAIYTSGNGTDTLIFDYTVSLNSNYTNDLTVSAINGNITDETNTLYVDNTIDNNLTDIQVIGIPKISSTVVSSSPQTGTFKINDTIDISVGYYTNVNIDSENQPTLTLSNGATATYLSGTSTNTLVFVYTVSALLAEKSNNLTINSFNGVLIDSDNYTASNDLNGNNINGIVIDVQKNITQVSILSDSAEYRPNDTIRYKLTFEDGVHYNTETDVKILLSNGDYAVYESYDEVNKEMTFKYVVPSTPSSATSNLTIISINDNAIFDDEFNLPIDIILPSITYNNISVRIISKLLTITAPIGTYYTGNTVPIRFTFDTLIDNNVNENIYIRLSPADIIVGYNNIQIDNNKLTFNYIVGENQNETTNSLYPYNFSYVPNDIYGNQFDTIHINNILADFNNNNPLPGIHIKVSDIISITTPQQLYKPTDIVNISITFVKQINNATSSKLTLSNGDTASYLSGQGTNIIVYQYTVPTQTSKATDNLNVYSIDGGLYDNENNIVEIDEIVVNLENVKLKIGSVLENIIADPGTYNKVSTINISLVFDEIIQSSTLILNLSNGNTIPTSSVSGNTVYFIYQPTIYSDTNNLKIISTSGVVLDTYGINVSITLNSGTLLNLQNIIIDDSNRYNIDTGIVDEINEDTNGITNENESVRNSNFTKLYKKYKEQHEQQLLTDSDYQKIKDHLKLEIRKKLNYSNKLVLTETDDKENIFAIAREHKKHLINNVNPLVVYIPHTDYDRENELIVDLSEENLTTQNIFIDIDNETEFKIITNKGQFTEKGTQYWKIYNDYVYVKNEYGLEYNYKLGDYIVVGTYTVVIYEFGSIGVGPLGGSSAGDPYVSPLFGNLYKLPDGKFNFRMLDTNTKNKNDRLIFNCFTDYSSNKEEEQLMLDNEANRINIDNSYYQQGKLNTLTFFKYGYIKYGVNSIYIDIDNFKFYNSYKSLILDENEIEENNLPKWLNIEINKKYQSYDALSNVSSLYKEEKSEFIKISIPTISNGKCHFILHKYINPQIRTGVSFIIENFKNITGALVRQSRKKYITLKKLSDTTNIKEPTNFNKSYKYVVTETFYRNNKQENIKFNILAN